MIVKQDKILHFLAGGLIFLIAQFFTSYALIPVVVIGAGKEVYDHFTEGHKTSVWDFVATVVGGLVMWGIV